MEIHNSLRSKGKLSYGNTKSISSLNKKISHCWNAQCLQCLFEYLDEAYNFLNDQYKTFAQNADNTIPTTLNLTSFLHLWPGANRQGGMQVFPWGGAWGSPLQSARYYPNITIIWFCRVCMFAVLLYVLHYLVSIKFISATSLRRC